MDISPPEQTVSSPLPRARIPVRVGLLVVAFVVIGLVAGSIMLIRYQPLDDGSVFGVDGAQFRTVTAHGDQDGAIFRYRHAR